MMLKVCTAMEQEAAARYGTVVALASDVSGLSSQCSKSACSLQLRQVSTMCQVSACFMIKSVAAQVYVVHVLVVRCSACQLQMLMRIVVCMSAPEGAHLPFCRKLRDHSALVLFTATSSLMPCALRDHVLEQPAGAGPE